MRAGYGEFALIFPGSAKFSMKKGEFDLVKKELSNSCAGTYFLDELDYDLRVEGIDIEEIYNHDVEEMEKLFHWKKKVYVLNYENSLNKKLTCIYISPHPPLFPF